MLARESAVRVGARCRFLRSSLKLFGRNGFQVMVSREHPLKRRNSLNTYAGSIVKLTKTEIRIAMTSHFEELESGFWRLDLAMTNVIFERMRRAITSFHCDLDLLEQQPGLGRVENILFGTGLRDVLLRSTHLLGNAQGQGHEGLNMLQAPDDVFYPKDVLSHDVREFPQDEFKGLFKEDMRIYSWAERYSLDNPLVMEGDPDLSHLNKSQIKAMATMIGKRISLVQGVKLYSLSIFCDILKFVMLASWNRENQDYRRNNQTVEGQSLHESLLMVWADLQINRHTLKCLVKSWFAPLPMLLSTIFSKHSSKRA